MGFVTPGIDSGGYLPACTKARVQTAIGIVTDYSKTPITAVRGEARHHDLAIHLEDEGVGRVNRANAGSYLAVRTKARI